MINSSSTFDRLRSLIAFEQEDIKSLVAYGIGIGLMSLATPIAVQALVNTIAFGALFQPLVVLTVVLMVLVGFSNFMAAMQFYVVDMLQRRLFVRLLGQSANNLQNAHYPLTDQQYLPELTNRFLDVVTLQKTAAVMLLETLGYLLQTLIGMILLAFYHPLLLAFDLFLIGMIAFVLFGLGKGGIPTAIDQSKAKYAAVAWLQGIAANPVLAKSTPAFLLQKTNQIAQDYLAKSQSHFEVLARQNVGALVLHALANTILLGMGGWMVIERQLSLGQLIAAELVVNAMIYGLTRLGKTLDNFYELVASTDKLNYLLDLQQEEINPNAPIETQQPYRVQVQNISLPSNPGQDLIVDLSLGLDPGEMIVFTEGVTKGSLFDILYGLRVPISGYVCLDGQDLRDLNLGSLRANISLIREPEVFAISILDNLRLGKQVDLGIIRSALEKVSLLEEILALPDGFNTTLVDHGKPLTAEQCLRLTLARVIITKPKLLLLDHALDRIDRHLVAKILDNMFSKPTPWTLLIASQLPEVIARCQRQARIDNGKMIIDINLTNNGGE